MGNALPEGEARNSLPSKEVAKNSLPFKGRAGVGMGSRGGPGEGMGGNHPSEPVGEGINEVESMLGQNNPHILKNKLQSALRRAMTDAERLLWQALRGRQMGGYKFRRQHPFDDFILDFVCLERRLVVEVDGAQHVERTEVDAVRTEKLSEAGFRLLRFWNHEVLRHFEAVKEKIWLELQANAEPYPHPNPLPEGEGINGKRSPEGEK